MSLFSDIEFLHQISYRLEKFKKIDERTWKCRCPICGDSKKNLNKTRGYFYTHSSRLNYKCHNCGVSTSLRQFVKQFDFSLFDAYIKQNYRESNQTPNTRAKIVRKTSIVSLEPTEPPLEEPVEENTSQDSYTPFKSVIELSDEHPIIDYLQSRMIPQDEWEKFAYVERMTDIPLKWPRYKDLIKTTETRLVIPFIDASGEMIGATCRALGDETPRYVELKFKDDCTLAFGLNTVDQTKTIYVLEGAIDSCFIPNSIAVAGMAMQKLKSLGLPKDKCVLVLDNQPKHRDVVKAYEKFIADGYKVCIWPKIIKGKDINRMVISGEINRDGIADLIDNHTESGLQARLKFNFWKGI